MYYLFLFYTVFHITSHYMIKLSNHDVLLSDLYLILHHFYLLFVSHVFTVFSSYYIISHSFYHCMSYYIHNINFTPFYSPFHAIFYALLLPFVCPFLCPLTPFYAHSMPCHLQRITVQSNHCISQQLQIFLISLWELIHLNK